ncbi:MAG: amidohydrolase [Lysobacterales bacterium RIFOXYA1_FULL_69_10]|nr:MAG: amidohydrolase [Xanthomonadales bacterium RIFOXYA1_FULL_69_10]
MALCAPLHAQDVTVLTAGRIHTMDPARPTARAMAFDAEGRILALDDGADLHRRYPEAARLDVPDSTVVPGLIDAHGHIGNLGLSLMRARLDGTRSRAEVVERLRAHARDLPDGDWLLGRGWDQNDWPDARFPTAADLDEAFPDRPVWLTRVDGHAGWANTAALRRVERDLAGDWQPDGGRIERDAQGAPSGVFIDSAMDLVEAAIPAMDAGSIERALELGMRSAVEHGLTGVHDAGVSLQQMQAYRRLADRGAMPMRIHAMADGDNEALAWLCRDGLYGHDSGRLQMRAVKLYMDGALGSRGAALQADYHDDAGNRGLLLIQPDALDDVLARAKACDVQVATHAIGDRGNRLVLDAYAKAWGETSDAGHRWRIEHAQVVAPGDLSRFARQHVIASMQPTHATSDMPWAEARLGPERVVGSYAWRTLRDHGTRLALGSDFPVESVDPRLGLFAAATRTDSDNMPVGGWRPHEKLTAFEALRGFTLDAAYAGFAEDEVGSLVEGKRADFVLLAEDPLAVPADALQSLTVQATYVDGQAVYRRGAE